MSISIGSNFLYQGKKFLDDRVEIVKKTEDLKNWDIPIPDGFEVFVEGSWYMFSSNNPDDPVTGKFKKRFGLSQEFGGSSELTVSQYALTNKINDLESNITRLTNKLYPLEFKSITGGGTFEVGSSITPQISWTIGIQGNNETCSPNLATVNSSSNGVSDDKLSWRSSEAIRLTTPGTKVYNVLVSYNQLNVEKAISYNFQYKKFYGTSAKPVLNSSDILSLQSSFVSGTSHTMGKTNFNCSGSKYPYYVIPNVIYKSTIEFWIGGLKNTDLVVGDVTVTTSTGLTIAYKTIRLKNIQTGNLSIEIK